MAGADAELLALWRDRQSMLAAIERRGDFYDAQTNAPGLIASVERNEKAIVDMPAATPAGALAKAWVAWSFIGEGLNMSDVEVGDLVRRADLAELAARRADLDFDQRAMLGVVEALVTMVEALTAMVEAGHA